MTGHSVQIVMIGSALALLASAANAGQDLVTVKDLAPFTHIVRIPADAERSSIRFEQVKLVKVPTKVRFTENARYCEQLAFRDPGGSSYCPSAAFEEPTAAYEVICSYNGPLMAADELGGTISRSVHIFVRMTSARAREKCFRKRLPDPISRPSSLSRLREIQNGDT